MANFFLQKEQDYYRLDDFFLSIINYKGLEEIIGKIINIIIDYKLFKHVITVHIINYDFQKSDITFHYNRLLKPKLGCGWFFSRQISFFKYF